MSEAEIAYTVASDNEATSDDVEAPFLLWKQAIGIDVGTFQCRVAVWKDSKVEASANPGGHRMMPSYVLFQGDTPSSGISSEAPYDRQQELLSGSAIFNVKRLVGRMDTTLLCIAAIISIHGRDIGNWCSAFIAALSNGVWRYTTPEEVLAILLMELRAMAEVQLGRAVRTVVLTMPVSFSRFQQTRIERACAMAGLHVLRLMPEPTAAALLYAQQQQIASPGILGSMSEKLAVIFNMGAGVLRCCSHCYSWGVSQIKALAGAAIGGEDILQNVLRYIAPDINSLSMSKGGDAVKVAARLRMLLRMPSTTLSSHDSASIEVDMGSGMKISKTLVRNEFEEINIEVFQKCENLIVQCLHDSQIDVECVGDVILVGGCSHIPQLRVLYRGFAKARLYMRVLKPLEAAVCGAALEGAIASGVCEHTLELLTIQATPLSLGVRADGTDVVPIVHRMPLFQQGGTHFSLQVMIISPRL